MTGYEIGVSISAVDLLRHVSEVFKAKCYTEIELTRIVAETKRFNDQLEQEQAQFIQQFETIKKTNLYNMPLEEMYGNSENKDDKTLVRISEYREKKADESSIQVGDVGKF